MKTNAMPTVVWPWEQWLCWADQNRDWEPSWSDALRAHVQKARVEAAIALLTEGATDER